VWNRTHEKAKAFAGEHDCSVGSTPREAVANADVVITCLPSSREVHDLMKGEDGLLAGLQAGALVIDCTSGDPATSVVMADELRTVGVDFVDAPVSGGVKGAVAGTLTVMCGGDARNIERARPILETFGKKIVHCGGVGAGDAVKAMNQALLAIHIWSAGEALATLARLGVSAEVALDVINGSSGRSNSSENLFPERVIGRRFPRTFKLALLDKDIDIAARISHENSMKTPLIDLAARLMKDAHAELGEDADHVEAVKVIEQRNDVIIS
jgi:3-hydroxyisobutyrate dehydrogenase